LFETAGAWFNFHITSMLDIHRMIEMVVVLAVVMMMMMMMMVMM
jgi:hypothetical protein